jgi:hypothetical protein
MSDLKVQRCWLCGHTTIYESGLCWPDYAWAERMDLDRDEDAEPLTEQEIREAYRAKKWQDAKAADGPHGRIK